MVKTKKNREENGGERGRNCFEEVWEVMEEGVVEFRRAGINNVNE